MFSHPKCYARNTGKCSRRISREHIISDSLLRLFEHNKTVKVAGLSWLPEKEFRLFSRNSFGSNILCTYHNSILSKYDAEIEAFAKCLIDYDADFNNSSPKSEHKKFKGAYIENWMLKTVCNIIAANQVLREGVPIPCILKDVYIEILFNGIPWQEGWGLYFKIPDKVQKYNCFGFATRTGNNEVKAADFLFNNFQFSLLLGKPDNPASFGIKRINKITFTNGSIEKVIEFEWEDKQHDVYVVLTRTGTSDLPPEEWEDWMKL